MRGEVRDGRREGGVATAAHAASRVRFRLEGLWRRARGGAHVEHVLHGCDAGRVEAQRLVERRGLLPSRKEGTMRGEVRDGRREGGAAARRKRRARGRAGLEGLGRRKLAERT